MTIAAEEQHGFYYFFTSVDAHTLLYLPDKYDQFQIKVFH